MGVMRILPRAAAAARRRISIQYPISAAGGLAGGPSTWLSAGAARTATPIAASAAAARAAARAATAAGRAPSSLFFPASLSLARSAPGSLSPLAALSTAAAAQEQAAAGPTTADASPAAPATTSPATNPTPPPPPPASVDYTTLLACCAELADPANGYLPAKVEEVVQSDAHTLALRLRTAGPHALSAAAGDASDDPPPVATHRYWLYVSWHPSAARLCASASDPPRGAASEAYAFGEQVGRLLKGLALCRVTLPRPWERVAALEFSQRPSEPPTRRLYAEVMGRHSNAVLTDAGSGGNGGMGASFAEDDGDAPPPAGASNKRATKRQRRQQQQEAEEAEFLRQLPGRQTETSSAAASSSLTQGQELVLAAGLQVGERQSSLRQLSAGKPFEPPPPALALSAAGGLLPELGEPVERWRRNVEAASELLVRAAAEQQKEQNERPGKKGSRAPSANDNDPPGGGGGSVWRPSFADCLVRAYVGVSPSLASEVAHAAGLVVVPAADDNVPSPPPRRRRPPAPPPPSVLSDDDWRRAHEAWLRWVAAVEPAHAVLLVTDGGSNVGSSSSRSSAALPKWRPRLDRGSNRYSVVALAAAAAAADDDEQGEGTITSSTIYPSAHALLDALHGPSHQAGAAHAQLHARLLSSARSALARSEARAAAFRKQLSAAEGADALRREADLVMANLYRIPVADAAGSAGSLASKSSSSSISGDEEDEGGGNGDADQSAPCALGDDGSWRVTLQDWETGEDIVLVLDGVGGALVPKDVQKQLQAGKKKKKTGDGAASASASASASAPAPGNVRPQAPLSARDHAEALYKRARKLRRAVDAVAPLLSAAEAEAAYLAELAASVEGLERYEGPDDLAALRGVETELQAALGGGGSGSGSTRSAAEAALAAKGAAKGRKAAKQQEKQKRQKAAGGGAAAAAAGGEDVGAAATVDGARPRRFVSPGGRVVLVGRHNRQNDALSLKAAAPNDVWMHVRGVPGSHVVLRASPLSSSVSSAASSPSPSSPPSSLAPDVSEACVQFAADLAVFFSKARHSGRADVVVCRAGELKKPRGARPGQVMVGKELGNAVGRPERVEAVAEPKGG